MAASGLSCRKPLVGTKWASSLLLCTNGPRKLPSGHVAPLFMAVKLFSCSIGVTRAVTIESLLDSGCGLSHISTRDGCNGSCVKLEDSNRPEVEIRYV